MTAVQDPLGNATYFTYDELNRQTCVKDALGNETDFGYDQVGNRTRVVDPLDRTAYFSYDYLNRLDGLAQTLIADVNTLHQSGFALDASAGEVFFVGTGSNDIAVNPNIVADPNLVAAAADALYKKHAKSLYVYLAHVLNVPNPEDVVHDVFIRVIEKAHQFDPKKASFRTWLFRIAHNHAVNLFRREKLVRFQSLEQNVGREGGGKALPLGEMLADESQNIDRSTLALAVRECVGRLTREIEKQAIVMYYIFGKNYEEMSGVFGKSISLCSRPKHPMVPAEFTENLSPEPEKS